MPVVSGRDRNWVGHQEEIRRVTDQMFEPIDRDELPAVAEHIHGEYEAAEKAEESVFPLAHPERNPIEAIQSDRERALFVTLTVAIAGDKPAAGGDGVWQTAKWFHETTPWLFHPQTLLEENDASGIAREFSFAGWATNQDAAVWYSIAWTLREEYDSDPQQLVRAHDGKAAAIEAAVTDEPDRWPFLSGPDTCRRWLWLLDQYVTVIDGVDERPIPATPAVCTVTNNLLGSAYSPERSADRDAVRDVWNRVGETTDLAPVALAPPLESLARDWGEWGEDFLTDVIEGSTAG